MGLVLHLLSFGQSAQVMEDCAKTLLPMAVNLCEGQEYFKILPAFQQLLGTDFLERDDLFNRVNHQAQILAFARNGCANLYPALYEQVFGKPSVFPIPVVPNGIILGLKGIPEIADELSKVIP